jgi:hypothetical protein
MVSSPPVVVEGVERISKDCSEYGLGERDWEAKVVFNKKSQINGVSLHSYHTQVFSLGKSNTGLFS